ncbi:Transcriptional regulatory protein zraR [Minicystis rosea]|nr:Transcriptional regulatory protein zraR [Minicystis rosea]
MIVCIVDDDASIREALSGLFRSAGLDVAVFASGEAFLESDAIDRTSCLVLDVQMPGMTGLELQARLTRDGHRIPIVFITAQTSEVLQTQITASGAAFLRKPFDEEELLREVERAVSTNGAPTR